MVQSTLSKPKQKQSSSLSSWFYQLLDQPGLKVKTQQRGNALHLLLEGKVCPEKIPTLTQLVQQLQASPADDRLAQAPAPIYRLLVYGRQKGESKPRWSQSLQLNQLERHQGLLEQQLEDQALSIDGVTQNGNSQVTANQPDLSQTSASQTSSLILSNRALAQQGDPKAIARYLSEELNSLGVSVRVAIKAANPEIQPAVSLGDSKRLWVLCEAPYSLDATATADLLASRLRGLELDGFQDAAVFSQVKGELKPDWSLRVDLTPPSELQHQWSRWGDEEAIALWLNGQLKPQGIELKIQLQGKTLHLFCRPTTPKRTLPTVLDFRDKLAPLLIDLAPQGIHGVSVYGLDSTAPLPPLLSSETAVSQHPRYLATPDSHPVKGDLQDLAWVDWINLPASEYPELAPTTLALAEQGDLAALSFLLTRLINPDIDEQLQTGGIRVQLLRRSDLLHVMCDAPRCPRRKDITRPISKYIRRLRLPKVAGLRVYGRRAGQAQPRWQYGRDFVPRQDTGVELAPRFKVTEATGGDLLTQDDAIAQSIGSHRSPWSFAPGIALPNWHIGPLVQPWLDRLHQGLVNSQFFVPQPESSLQLNSKPNLSQAVSPASETLKTAANKTFGVAPTKLALIWAALGLVVTGSADLVLGQVLTLTAPPREAVDLASSPNALGEVLLGDRSSGSDNASGNLGGNGDGFLDNASLDSFNAGPKPSDSPAIAALMEQYPSFNNPLFNEKLALYRQRVAEEGPPDVLILGSSRALRGVDPAALAAGLGKIGKPDLKIFNFSINGSTAQVVELQLLMILEPEHLPGIILWADGARAFNSGRSDRTYEAIAESEAYRRLLQNTLPALFSPGGTLVATQLQERRPITSLLNIQGLDNALDNGFSRLSAVHSRRAQLKHGLGKLYARSASGLQPAPDPEGEATLGYALDVPEGEGFIDFDGFMPLSLRFNPATYYQNYSRVTGEYDKDYQGFRMEGDQTRSLETVIQITRQYGVPLVFVNLPLTEEYLDPVRSRYESLFQKNMFRRMTQRQLIFRDLSQLWPKTVDNFSDPSHLNRYGARRVSSHLAEDPMIPWPSLPRR